MPDSAPPNSSASRGQAVRRLALWVALCLLGAGWYGAARLAAPLSARPFADALHGNDFKHLYAGAWLLRQQESPYDAAALYRIAIGRGMAARGEPVALNPYVYLPFTGQVLSPLTLLAPPGALRAWFLVSHALFLSALCMIYRSAGFGRSWSDAALFLLAAALCFPFHRTLTAGQLSAALLFLFALVYWLDARGHRSAAACTAAFAFLFKLTPGILFVYFAMRRRWRAMAVMFASTAVLLGASVLWAGVEIHRQYLPVLRDMGYGKSTWAGAGNTFYRDAYNQSINSLMHHLFASGGDTTPWVDLGPGAANALTWLALLGIAGVAGLGLWRNARQAAPRRPEADRTFAVLVLVSMLTPAICWDHYAVIAMWPLLIYATRLSEPSRAGAALAMAGLALGLGAIQIPQAKWQAISLACMILGLAAGGLLSASAPRRERLRAFAWAVAGGALLARFHYGAEPLRQGIGLLGMSLKLWGLLALLGLWAWAPPRPGERP